MLNNINKETTINTDYTTQYSYILDKTNQLTYNDIKSRFDNFIPSSANKIPFELSAQSYWVNVKISNLTNKSLGLVLYADNVLLDVFSIFYNNTEIKKNDVNYQIDKYQKVYPHKKILIEKNQTDVITLNIQTNGPPNVPLMVLTEKDFKQRILYTQMIYGAFIGIILLMTVYNLIIFFAIKDKVYLLYIGYLISSFFVLSSLTGFGYFIFPEVLQSLINQHLLFIDYYLAIFLLTFTLYFLRYDKQNNKSYKIGFLLTIGLVLCSFYSLSLDMINQTKLFFTIQPAIFIFTLFLLFRRIKYDFTWAKFYLLSWIPLLIGVTIQPLAELNYLEHSYLTRHSFLLAVIAEITLMAFALAERMRQNEKGRLTDITYHNESGLPRKSNIESYINKLRKTENPDFSIIFIQPEHIDKISMYVDDETHTKLFQHLFRKLSSLFEFNDAIYRLTDEKDKICLINNNSLLIIINNKRSKQAIDTLMASIQQIVRENYKIKDIYLPLSANIGIAKYPDHGTHSHQLIHHANMAAIKSETLHHKWCYFEADLSDKKHYFLKLAQELKASLETAQLAIYHQPQLDLRTLRVCSSECLLRWHHPKEGDIPPAIFLPIAEDMGLIHQLTLWVVKQSLEQQWVISQEHEYNHMVSINISGKEILSEHFFVNMLEIIDESTIPADKIIFELSESTSFANNESALILFNKLTELGITISIDDFGTGYSTISQISNMPIQELKIDREFVENVNSDSKRKIITETTVKMAKGLGFEVVAEGINSQEDEDTLRKYGCDIGQGYFYSKPLPLDDYLKWLENLDNGRKKQPLSGEFIPADKTKKPH